MFGKGKHKRDRQDEAAPRSEGSRRDRSDAHPHHPPQGIPLPSIPDPSKTAGPQGPTIGGRIAESQPPHAAGPTLPAESHEAPAPPSAHAASASDMLSESAVAMKGLNDHHPIDPATDDRLASAAEHGPDRPEVIDNERAISGSSAPGSHEAGDKVIKLIDDVESRVTALSDDLSEAPDAPAPEQLGARERRVVEAEARNKRYRDKLESASQQLKAKRDAIRNAEQDAAESQAILDRLIEQNKTQSAELEAKAESLASREAELNERASAIAAQSSSLDERSRAIEEQSQQLEQREQAAKELAESATGGGGGGGCDGACQNRIDEAQRRVDELAALNESLTAQLSDRPEPADEDDAETEALRQEIEQLRTALDEAAAQAASASSAEADAASDDGNNAEQARIEALDAQLAELHTGIEKRDNALRLLKTRLEQTNQALTAAQQQQAAPVGPSPEDIERLQAELEAARRSADEQRARVDELERSAAQRAAEQRAEAAQAAEKLHHEREAFADEKAKVAALVRKSHSAGARGKASVIVASLMVALAATAGIAWFVAGKIQEPWHLATAQLAADGGRLDTLTEQQRADWQNFHQKLLADPQLAAAIGDRLKAQGFAEFGSASDVRTLINEQLDIGSAENGRLDLALTGKGSDRTRRVLDTFATTMSRYANDIRSGSIATGLVSPVAVTDEPVRDERADMFLMVAGGGSALVVLLWLVVWSRLRNDKQAFEEQIMLGEHGLDGIARQAHRESSPA